MSRTASSRPAVARLGVARVGLGTSLLLVGGLLVGVSPASAAPTPGAPVDLGSAAGFSVLAGPSITSTGAGTVLALDLGVTGTLAGFPPGKVTGATRVGDAAVKTAHADRQAAYASVAAQTDGTPFAGDLAGKTFTPGLHTAAAAITNTGTITLDAAGDPGATFVFQIGAALSSAAASKVVLANGALANNVYWQVVGAVALGADAEFVGTLLGAGVISFGAGASLKGRALTASTVALADSPITQPIDDLVAPAVTIDGGSAASTADTTPRISGTTDEPGTPVVTVKTGTQVLTARASNGVWAVSAGTLTAGPHTLVASVTDPSQNTGTATQVLTVDTSLPVVDISGGATTATNDTTPTISGTTDQPGSPEVTVTVGGQTLITTADASGSWSVTADPLSETAHLVQAFVEDAAGSIGSGTQVLTVDVTLPVLTINGGPTRSTSDTSPWVYGTTAEKAGTTVQVRLGGQSLTAAVQPGGAWGVSAETVASGTYSVLASITDAAGNTGFMGQVLQVGSVVTAPDGVTPPVGFDDGATAETSSPTPTISGTTDVPGAPTVVVTVDGQTLTTTADDGVWSVEVAPLPEGPHTVVVRIIDADGNVTSTTQQLTVSSATPPVVPPVDLPVTPPAAPPAAAAQHRPDAEIRLAKRAYIGRGTFSVSRQKITATLNGRRARSTTYTVRVTNRGTVADRITLRGSAGSRTFAVRYRQGSKNVTSAVRKGTYRTPTLQPGRSVTLTVRITKVKGAAKGSRRTFSIRSTSGHDRTRRDTVAAVVKVKRS